MPPSILFFDIGNVLLKFDPHRACRQIAALAHVEPEQVWQALFDSGLALRYEAGEHSTDEFHALFCQRIRRDVPLTALSRAASDIFEINWSIKPLVSQLARAGHRLGLLSNTNEMHWNFYSDGRYALIPEAFDVHALSFRLKAMKPAPEIYVAAAKLGGVRPEQAFFVDDIEANVAGAMAAGIDAILYTDASTLAHELRKRGVKFNY